MTDTPSARCPKDQVAMVPMTVPPGAQLCPKCKKVYVPAAEVA